MAEPPDPNDPSRRVPPPPDDGPDDSGWVRPSQRRPAPPPPPPDGEPTVAGPTDTPADPDPTTDAVPPAAATIAAAGAGHVTRAGQRRRRHRRRGVAVASGALVVVLAILAGILLTSGGGTAKPVARRHVIVTTTTAPGPPPAATVLTTKVPTLQAFDQPSATAASVASLTAKTDYGLPRTLLASNQQPGWFQVLLPKRPNDSQGWVRASDVTPSNTDYAIRIQLSAHHLWLTKAGAPVLDTGVVIGKTQTPTPTGLFYVTDPVDLQTTPNGAYGAFALGLSGYSNVLTSFEGGPGQIAVHGTPYADQVGQDISNGCVRIPNAVIVQIAKLVPLGTPVSITA